MKYLVLVSLFVAWLNVGIMLKFWYKKGTRSVSKVAGSSKLASLIFGVLSLIANALFLIFIYRYFIPHFQPETLLRALLYAASFCLVLVAFLPDFEGILNRLHGFFAYTMGAFMFYIGVTLVYSHQFGLLPRSIDALLVIVMLLSLFRGAHDNQKHYIYYQLSFIGSFHLIILASTFLR